MTPPPGPLPAPGLRSPSGPGAADRSAKVYFPGLNGLRFFAALTVVIVHVNQIMPRFGYPAVLPEVNPLTGKLAVIFFFVLSGFLITYLLLAERRATEAINARSFYIRRLLRIWPLYYLMVLTAFFIWPHTGLYVDDWQRWIEEDFSTKFILYMVMLPNLAEPIAFISHFWSIGVEEQFYLVWPLLNKLARRTITLCLGVIGVYMTALVLLHLFGSGFSFRVWSHLRIDCMAIGGIFATLLFRDARWFLDLMYARLTQVLVFAALAALFFLWVEVPLITYDLYGLLFAAIILNVASNPHSLLRLENPILNYLGKISYGVYVYHILAVALTLKAVGPLLAARLESPAFGLAVYAASIATTIAISSLSYHSFERPFLKLKGRFSKITSGDEARSELAANEPRETPVTEAKL